VGRVCYAAFRKRCMQCMPCAPHGASVHQSTTLSVAALSMMSCCCRVRKCLQPLYKVLTTKDLAATGSSWQRPVALATWGCALNTVFWQDVALEWTHRLHRSLIHELYRPRSCCASVDLHLACFACHLRQLCCPRLSSYTSTDVLLVPLSYVSDIMSLAC
jgi:hypothetical protein